MDQAEARALLRRAQILSDLSDGEIDQLNAGIKWKRVTAGEGVISHLDPPGSVYFAIEGAFSGRLESPVGRRVAIRQIKAGGHFGELAALSQTARSLSVTADCDGLLAECPTENFFDLMTKNGRFATAVAAHLARTIISLTDRVFELAALEVRFRIYAELLRLASNAEKTDEGHLIRNAPTHEAIADATGTQREAVNRELRVLAGDGILRQNRRELLILDIEKLRDLLHRRAGATTSETLQWRF